jgi:CheY-like chemotaxis protein
MQAAINENQAMVPIVDDTAANLKLFIRILSDRGYTVHAANSGETALDL